MGKISSPFGFQLRSVMVLSLLQLCCTIALVIWWGHLLLEQNDEIFELKNALSRFDSSVEVGFRQPVRNMIISESIWFIAVVVVTSLFLVGLYLRDIRRNSSLQAFFASLTHELKTPLTSIRLQAETIEEYSTKDQYLFPLSKRLLEDTNRLENRVERSLELARVEGGGPLHLQNLDLAQCINEAVRSCVASYKQSIDITHTIEHVFIRGDRNAMRIVLTNLLENSIIHGGKKPISVNFSAVDDGPKVILTYHDNGSGMSKELKKVGSLFYRGKESQGAGIGLYLVVSLIKAMGGEVRFDSKGQGFIASMSFLTGEHNIV